MNKKYFKNLLNFSKIIILLVFLFAGFFGFGHLLKVYAYCSYNIQKFYTNAQTASPKDTINFNYAFTYVETGTTINDINACNQDKVTIKICSPELSKLSSIACATNGKLNCDTQTKICSSTATLDLANSAANSSAGAASFQNLSSLTFNMSVQGSSYTANAAPVTVNVSYSGNVTTAPPTNGVKQLNISFDKQLYSKDDTATISVSMRDSDVRNLPSAVSKIRMDTTVGGQKVGSYEFNKNDLLNGSKPQTVKIAAPPFIDGSSNNVQINMYDVGSGALLAQGAAKMTVQGLGSNTKPVVSVVGGAKQKYAIGDTITLSAQNIPNNATVELDINDYEYKVSIPGSSINGYTIIVSASDFETTGTNNLDIVVTAADGKTELYSGNLAQFTIGATSDKTGGSTGGTTSSGFDCSQANASNPDYSKHCLYNPLPKDTLTDVLLYIMKGFLGILAAWAVAFIVIGGFRMVMSQGNEEAYTTAKKTITWAIIGLVIALLSFAIVAMVQNFLGVKIEPVKTSQTSADKHI
jgi:hypothetical protein